MRCIAFATVVLAMASSAFGSTVVPMGFEETAAIADVIVLGHAIESPEFGFMDQRYGVVVRRHRFAVTRYLKGDGPPEIFVETLGGKFVDEVDGKQRVLIEPAGPQPQLPDVGTEALVFLTRYGAQNHFMICSASHGVRQVFSGDKGQPAVQLDFQKPSVMTPRALQRYQRLLRSGQPLPPRALFSDVVSISEIEAVVQRVLDNAKPVRRRHHNSVSGDQKE